MLKDISSNIGEMDREPLKEALTRLIDKVTFGSHDL